MVLKSIVFYLKSGREVKLNVNMDIDVEKFKSVYNSNLKTQVTISSLRMWFI